MVTGQPVSGKLVSCASGLIGLFLVVIQPLGPHWALLPADIGDARFNNYLLEHFFRWISGLDTNYWTASFFYPFPHTIAFGDNLLGSAPIYATLRYLGMDRESAFQGWYVVGYALNYMAAGYVLSRLRFGPWATGVGAFFFAFGLPVLAQDVHVQSLYRFAVPPACYFLWKMVESPRLSALLGVIFWAVWQFYLTIYAGVFLALLLAGLVVLAPLAVGEHSLRQMAGFWPSHARAAWQRAAPVGRVLAAVTAVLLGAALVSLISPYWHVKRLYEFGRPWVSVAVMLPTWKSYLLANRAPLWAPISRLIPDVPIHSDEHQLFPGIAAMILAAMAAVWLISRRNSENGRVVLLHFWTGSSLVVVTLLVHGYSLYWFLWNLPGIDSIRAVTRIILVLMWPLAVLIAYGIDVLSEGHVRRHLLRSSLAAVLSGLLVAESALFDHHTYGKAESQTRLSDLRAQLPAALPNQPILVFANQPADPWWATEIDAILLSQDLGWPVLNGYSGNFAPGYGPTVGCSTIPKRIMAYMEFSGITDATFYLDMMSRTVPIGFDDCDPSWWLQRPTLPSTLGSVSRGAVAGPRLNTLWMGNADQRVRAGR